MKIRAGAIMGWFTVTGLLLAGSGLHASGGTFAQDGLFAWLIVVVLWSAFDAVQEAEALARELREPFGTLVLTMSVSAIEVVLICAAMFVDEEAATLPRDAMFSVLMTVLNGVVGIGLLMGGYHYHEQLFNLQGATAYLSVVIPLSTIALVLPSITTSTSICWATLLAELLDRGLAHLGIPAAIGGIVIALLVFAPEGMSTLIAVGANQLTKAINVSLGAATSTLGISVPVTLLIGLARGQPVVLGLPPAGIVLLAATLPLTSLTFLSARTTMLVGAVHLSLFVAFLCTGV